MQTTLALDQKNKSERGGVKQESRILEICPKKRNNLKTGGFFLATHSIVCSGANSIKVIYLVFKKSLN